MVPISPPSPTLEWKRRAAELLDAVTKTKADILRTTQGDAAVRADDDEEAWFITGPSGTTDFKRTCHSLERRLQELQEIHGFLRAQPSEPRASEERGPATGARKRTTRSPVLEGQAGDKRPRTAAMLYVILYLIKYKITYNTGL